MYRSVTQRLLNKARIHCVLICMFYFEDCAPCDVPDAHLPGEYQGAMIILVDLSITCQDERLVVGWKVKSKKSGSFKAGIFRPVNPSNNEYQLIGSNTLQVTSAGYWVSDEYFTKNYSKNPCLCGNPTFPSEVHHQGL